MNADELAKTPWQYTDKKCKVVMCTEPDGKMHSAMIDAPHVQAWIAAGGKVGAPPPVLLSNEAVAALNSGVEVVSASTPALNGTYAIDPPSLDKLFKTGTYVLAFSAFPNAQVTWTILDLTGTPRTFPTTAVFLSTLRGIADYVAQLDQIVDGLSSATALPSQTINVP